MGGSGGKRYRDRLKRTEATINGNFNSIGNASEQKQNLALVTRLLGEIGHDGYYSAVVDSNERLFLTDCKIKLNQEGSRATYGWRQVEKLVAIHSRVMKHREGHNGGQVQKAKGESSGAGQSGEGTGSGDTQAR